MKFLTSRHNAGLLIPFLLGIYLVGTSSLTLLPEVGLFDGKRILELLLLLLLLSITVLNPCLRVSYQPSCLAEFFLSGRALAVFSSSTNKRCGLIR